MYYHAFNNMIAYLVNKDNSAQECDVYAAFDNRDEADKYASALSAMSSGGSYTVVVITNEDIAQMWLDHDIDTMWDYCE